MLENLWKTSVIATKITISEIDERISRLFYAQKFNTQSHLSLKAQRKELCQYLQVLQGIRSFCQG